jgi:hypothetical protein
MFVVGRCDQHRFDITATGQFLHAAAVPAIEIRGELLAFIGNRAVTGDYFYTAVFNARGCQLAAEIQSDHSYLQSFRHNISRVALLDLLTYYLFYICGHGDGGAT